MNLIHKYFGRVCEHCPVCRYARKHPEGSLYKFMDSKLHGSWCPAWQGYKKLEAEGKIKQIRKKPEKGNNNV